MTLTLDLTPEQEAKIRNVAQSIGVELAEYLIRVIDNGVGDTKSKGEDMVAHLRTIGVIGAVKGTPRADGRPWSEIEAACDAD